MGSGKEPSEGGSDGKVVSSSEDAGLVEPRTGETPRARVFDIERYATHDGPGIRTTVFLKGCPLRCLWCHNPEAMSPRPTLLFTAEKCIACGACVEVCRHGVHRFVDEVHVLDRARCETCGDCAGECFSGALELAGREMTPDEALIEVLRDRTIYERSGGGMTVSGGEPLSHYPWTLELVRSAKREGLHVAVDTSGYCPWPYLEGLAPHTDLFLYDLKQMNSDRHKELTGVPNERILDNLQRLDSLGIDIWIRLPLIPGLNDDSANYEALGEFIGGLRNVRRVEILRYHRLAESKYERMGMPYSLQGLDSPSEVDAEARMAQLVAHGIDSVVWR